MTDLGNYFKTRLSDLARKHGVIVDVRGLGLMLAIELDSADLAKQAVAEMLNRKILINRTSETVLRFLPPYILQKMHVDETVDALDQVFQNYAPHTVASSSTGAKANG